MCYIDGIIFSPNLSYQYGNDDRERADFDSHLFCFCVLVYGHCKNFKRVSWIIFSKLELGILIPAKESLVSDIGAGYGNIAKLFL